MAEPQDIILPLLQELRGEIKKLGLNAERQFTAINERLDRMDGRLANMREAIKANWCSGATPPPKSRIVST